MPTFPTDSSSVLKEHIKASEALVLHAYLDPVGVPTAGYGHTTGITANMAKVKTAITTAQAEAWFEADLDVAERAVRDNVTVSLSQGQFDALVDFVFNVGVANFKSSTLLKRLNAGDRYSVPTELMRWTKATDRKTGKKVELAGLVTRRQWETQRWTGTDKIIPGASGPATYTPDAQPNATVIPAKPDKVTLFGLIVELITTILGVFRRA